MGFLSFEITVLFKRNPAWCHLTTGSGAHRVAGPRPYAAATLREALYGILGRTWKLIRVPLLKTGTLELM